MFYDAKTLITYIGIVCAVYYEGLGSGMYWVWVSGWCWVWVSGLYWVWVSGWVCVSSRASDSYVNIAASGFAIVSTNESMNSIIGPRIIMR